MVSNSTSLNKYLSYVFAILTIGAFIVFVIYRLEVLRGKPFTFAPIINSSGNLIVGGVFNTILVSVLTLIGSMILGFILYLFAISKTQYFKSFADVFTEIIYGTPLLVMVVIMAFVIGPAFGTFNRNLMGFLALVVYMAPYMKNVYKSAFSIITAEQYMAMDLFGFTPFQRYRYIIIPQVIRVLMPPLMNNFSLIVKGSALLYVLAEFTEIYTVITIAQSKTLATVEGFVLMWILYLIITIPLSQATKLIERKWSL
jgi:polar amino acid transport system permease protein